MRIANCSGFYGDRLSAPADLLAGPEPFDVLTGDYLAELTMLLLWKARRRDPGAGYARSFLVQMDQVLDQCLDRGIRVVSNAGGLDPHGLAARLAAVGSGRARVAVVDGDDLTPALAELRRSGEALRHLSTGRPLEGAAGTAVTAHAYLGGWGIADALAGGADVVVCGRVTDAALTLGPAAWWHGWDTGDWDALAGGVAAGHIIECGAQATGGNYPFTDELAGSGSPGFPIAEVARDGSCVITKQPGTGGAVTVGTVTAQLLYEIEDAAYPNPDVVARFDSLALTQVAPDRVAVRGARGEPAPARLKVGLNLAGGYRNSMTLVLTGLDIEAKAARAEAQLFERLGGRQRYDAVDVQLLRTDRPDAPTNEAATAQLRITVKGADPTAVGAEFSAAVTELALASYAGFFTSTPPSRESAFCVYWPALVDAARVPHVVTAPDGSRHQARRPPPAVDHPAPDPTGPDPAPVAPPAVAPPAAAPPAAGADPGQAPTGGRAPGPTAAVPLGAVCGARSGDKGGNATLGVWTWDDAAYRWLRHFLTPSRVQQLVPEAADLEVRRAELENLRALAFVIVGLLGDGVASSVRLDPQAKGLGEYLRSRTVEVPASLLGVRRDVGPPAGAGTTTRWRGDAGPPVAPK